MGEVGSNVELPLQINLGYLCNQTCLHCHVNAGSKCTELMDEVSLCRVCSTFLKSIRFKTLDLTGGVPEMNPHFRHLVKQARSLGVRVTHMEVFIVMC